MADLFEGAYLPAAAPVFRGNYYRTILEARAWQGPFTEDVIEPDLPIVDAHHHLQEDGRGRYLFEESVADMATGHNFIATVHVQARSMMRAAGPAHLRDIGEIEFARGVAAMAATGLYGGVRVCEGIVGWADFRLDPALVAEILDASEEAAGSRFRGVRQIAPWVGGELAKSMPLNAPEGLYRDPSFRRGFAELARRGHSFDAWLFHPQLNDVALLADAYPDTPIILNHLGGRLGIGQYASRFDAEYPKWKASIHDLARRRNIHVKVGGLGMLYGGFDFHTRPKAPTSEGLAKAWGPFIREAVDAFGPDRAMMESNFPVDNQSAAFPVIWNAFKRATQGYTRAERESMFHGAAQRVYRLSPSIEKFPRP
jgi:predicted TIM-barrel fold metal-dependent hydrolase